VLSDRRRHDGQSVKTESSRRLVPIHPDLLELGLRDRVERLRAEGVERLFPEMRIDSKSGAGNAISKAFSYYISTLGVKPRRGNGTVGFHSLRKTVIQELQGSNLPAERRRALVGHEAGEDVHAGDYMRAWSAKELSLFFPGLQWGGWLDFDGLCSLLRL
jgi:integrase